MWYHEKNGIYVGNDQSFQIDGVQYPGNWLQLVPGGDINAIGLVPVMTVGERKDDRFYDNSEVLDGATLTISAARKDAATIAAIKWGDIKAERDRRTESGGYRVGDKWFHSDQKSRSQQLELVLLGSSIPAGLQWKTMDGTFVTMTQTLAQQVIADAAASDQAIFAVAEAHKVAMEACADPVVYDFSRGWPEAYGEQAHSHDLYA